MKMQLLLCILLVGCILASCSHRNLVVESSTTASSENDQSLVQSADNTSASEISSSTDVVESEVQSSGESALGEVGGYYEMCSEHAPYYHVIDYDLILYVGEDNFNAWTNSFAVTDEYGRPQEGISIASFLQHFDVPRDIVEANSDYYSEDQLDAIYSGDQSQINEAFCGDLAYYNPSDGQLYSIYWLSDHTAADYQAAGVPISEVERILEDASAMGGSYASLAEAAAPAAEAYALE